MCVETTLYLVLASLGAAFVQRVAGFGFGIFIMTVLPYLMPSYGEATALSGSLAMITSAIIVWKMRQFLSWRKLWIITLTFLVVSYMAVQGVSLAEGTLMRRVLGGVLLFGSIWFFCLSERIHIRPTATMQVSMGVLAGLMGGFFAMQGPPAVLYFIASTDRKEEYMALVQCFFLVGNLFMTAFRASAGFVTPEVGVAWLLGLPTVLIGTWIGDRVFCLLPIKVLRKVIYAYMGFSGLLALFM